ncbi:PREDICTED: FAS1 domain-containing protein SELMODRAFT_448915-like [Lupinus angustifolius]|uniref:FAS1 domain-containing protein SELMODRAFT_448915-like n=1 Tax=Lupinus angustifolius TaxID=3871 RepID=UPI00092FA425|nr:PREDICTED: FAS1 domain-containing protein SELMODRAFT_448915-like [Lupinus angustifolius]
MANNMFFVVFLLLLMFFSSVTPTEINQDLVAATKEMQKANYFTFVMLINMSPLDTRLEGNVTFLMPNDRMLANNMVLQEGFISSFLLRHSVPSPLIFETLEQFPTGTIIPSSLPNCMLRVSNYGRRNFVLNNVKIISRNICTAGSSIRCHGIDGVLSEDCVSNNNSSVPTTTCSNSTFPSCMASPPIPSPTRDNLSPTFGASSPSYANVGTQKSGSHSYVGSLNLVTNLMLFLLIGIYF